MKIVLHSTNCPRCNILDMKLRDKGVEYTVNTNVDDMIAKGFQNAPILEVDGKYYEFGEAVKYIGTL